jgi:hypothetical protein
VLPSLLALVSSFTSGQALDRGSVSSDTIYLVHGLMDDAGYSALLIAGKEFGVGYKVVGGCYPLTDALNDSVQRVNARVDSVLIHRHGADAPQRLGTRIRELDSDLALVDSALHADGRFRFLVDSASSDPENLVRVEYELGCANSYGATIRMGKHPGPLPVIVRMLFAVDRERRSARRI